MHKTIKLAILGAGRMGKTHFDNLSALPKAEVRYVFDPFLSSDHEQLFPKEILSNSLGKILEDQNIDACVIATPSSFHVEYIQEVAKRGKHIFCEKPISFDQRGLELAEEAINKHGVKLQVGFNRRFDPNIENMHTKIKNDSLGQLLVIKITNRDPLRPNLAFAKNSGGLFYDFNIHDFDTLRFISGQEISEIYAMGSAIIMPELKELDDIDTALISLRLKNGALAIIDASRETGYGYDQQIEALGKKAMIALPNLHQNTLCTLNTQGAHAEPIEFSFVERYKESYLRQFEHFLSSIESNISISPCLDDAKAAVKAASCAMRSFKEQRPVRFEV